MYTWDYPKYAWYVIPNLVWMQCSPFGAQVWTAQVLRGADAARASLGWGEILRTNIEWPSGNQTRLAKQIIKKCGTSPMNGGFNGKIKYERMIFHGQVWSPEGNFVTELCSLCYLQTLCRTHWKDPGYSRTTKYDNGCQCYKYVYIYNMHLYVCVCACLPVIMSMYM